MGAYRGRIQMSGVVDRPLDISMDLDREHLTMKTWDGREIGPWPLDTVRITGRDDGFTIQIDGIPAWVRTEDDGGFALEVGLQWAPPRLRRLMAMSGRSVERHAAMS